MSRLRTATQGLNPHQQELIKKTSLTPRQIFEYMDNLNEEIIESHAQPEGMVELPVQPEPIAQQLPTLKPCPPLKEVPMQDLDDMQRQLEEEVRQAEAKAAAHRAQQEAELKAQPDEELSPAELQRQAILDLLARTPGAPNENQIQGLKAKYGGSLHVLALGEGDVYIFTHLRRGQFQQIRKLVQAGEASQVGGDPEELMKEKIVQHTVIWPKVGSPEFLYNSRAGVIDTLYQTILLHSYFLTPQQAMHLTTSL